MIRITLTLLVLLLASPAHAQRTALTGPLTITLSNAVGVADVPNCGIVTPFCRTKDGAYDQTISRIDGMSFSVTIYDPNCVDAGPLAADNPLVGIALPIFLIGNDVTPCLIESPSGDTIFADGKQNTLNIHGFHIRSSNGTVSNGIYASGGARIEVGCHVILGQSSQTRAFSEGGGSEILYLCDHSVAEVASQTEHVINYGIISGFGLTVTCLLGQNTTLRWTGIGGGSEGLGNMTYNGCTNVAQSAFVHVNGTLRLTNTTLPGSGPNYAGGNFNDNIDAIALTSWGGLYWGGSQAAGTVDAYSVLRFTDGDHPIVMQNPFMSRSPGGSCSPSLLC